MQTVLCLGWRKKRQVMAYLKQLSRCWGYWACHDWWSDKRGRKGKKLYFQNTFNYSLTSTKTSQGFLVHSFKCLCPLLILTAPHDECVAEINSCLSQRANNEVSTPTSDVFIFLLRGKYVIDAEPINILGVSFLWVWNCFCCVCFFVFVLLPHNAFP